MEPVCPIARWALKTPDALALSCGGRRWSYAEMDREVARWNRALATAGIDLLARVALLSQNRPELVPLLFALWRRDGTAVLLNARLTREELAPQIAHAAPVLVIAERALEEFRLSDTPAELPARPANRDAIRAILFTSGTTGRAKAVALTEENLDASARASRENIGGSPSDRWLLCMPIFHVGGLTMIWRCAAYGCGLVLHPRFDAEAVSESIDRDGITHASFVPTALARLVEARRGRPFPPGLQAFLVGGGPVPAELLQRARALGAPVLQTYGLTEACSQVTTERPGEADGQTAGPPLPGISVRIVDSDGSDVPRGEVGEIEVLGPTVMAGYWGDESETHQTLWKGWLRTHDLGSLDEKGRLRVFARRTDLIVSGGENVYPAEVEAVLLSLPGVEDAAVAAAPDPQWGQVPVAAVVARAGVDVTQLGIKCRERLAGFKVPRRIVRVAELPRNPGGKVDRERLQALLGAPKSRL